MRGTSADVGLYAAAQNLAVPPGLFALSLAPLLLATLGRLRRDGAEADARRIARDALRVSLALVPFAALVAGTADDLVRVVFGPSFGGAGLLLALLFAAGVALVVMSVAAVTVRHQDARSSSTAGQHDSVCPVARGVGREEPADGAALDSLGAAGWCGRAVVARRCDSPKITGPPGLNTPGNAGYPGPPTR